MPTLCTSVDVASWLELTPSELDWFADVRGLNSHAALGALQHYTFRWLGKRHGGHGKTRVMRPSRPQRLLGLVVNQRPNVPRAERERVEAMLTNALRFGLESQDHAGHPRFLECLRGRVAWIEQVNPAHARKLRLLLRACEAAESGAVGPKSGLRA